MSRKALSYLVLSVLLSSSALAGVNSGGGGSFIIGTDGTVTWGDDRLKPSTEVLNLGTPTELTTFAERIRSDLKRASQLFVAYGGSASFFPSKIFGRTYRLLLNREFNAVARKFCPDEYGQLDLGPGEIEAAGGCTYGDNTFLNSDLLRAALRHDLVTDSYSVVRAIVHEGLHGLYPLLDHSRWNDITSGIRTLLIIDRRQQNESGDFRLSPEELAKIETLRRSMNDFDIATAAPMMRVHPNGGGLFSANAVVDDSVVLGIASRVVGAVELGRNVRVLNSTIAAIAWNKFKSRIEIRENAQIKNSNLISDATEDSHYVESDSLGRSEGSKLNNRLPLSDSVLNSSWVIGAGSRLVNSKISGCGSLETENVVLAHVGIGLPVCGETSHFASGVRITGTTHSDYHFTYLSNRRMNLGPSATIADTLLVGFDSLEIGREAKLSNAKISMKGGYFSVWLKFGDRSEIRNLGHSAVRAADSLIAKKVHWLDFPEGTVFDFAGQKLCKNDEYDVSLGGGFIALDSRLEFQSIPQIHRHCRKKR